MDFGDKIGLQPLYLLNVFAITFPHDSIFFLFLMFCCEILEKEAVNQVIFEKRAVKPSEKSLQTVLEAKFSSAGTPWFRETGIMYSRT